MSEKKRPPGHSGVELGDPAVDADADKSLERVLARLEESLQVDLIATYEPHRCSTEDNARRVLSEPALSRFDQFPVSDSGRVVGVLERGVVAQNGDSTVAAIMRPLDDSMVISASTGVLSYIELARESEYHLVVRGHRISGIVTPSDLLKLPVRTVLFTLITHLESSMARAIRSRFPDDTWLAPLNPGRRQKLADEYAKLEAKRREPDRLLLTQFCDKRDILSEQLFVGADRTKFKEDIGALEDLRNNVMHSNEYPSETGYLHRNVESAKLWIQRLDNMA